MKKDAAYIEARIRWAATKQGLPSGNASLVSLQDVERFPLLARIPHDSNIGKPILVFATEGRDWSVLGTGGIGGENEGHWREAKYADVTDTKGFLDDPGAATKNKSQLDTLVVCGETFKYRFKSSPGSELFALWSICRRIVQIVQGTS